MSSQISGPEELPRHNRRRRRGKKSGGAGGSKRVCLAAVACAAAILTLISGFDTVLTASVAEPSRLPERHVVRIDEPLTPIRNVPEPRTAGALLGERLFADPRLSGDGSRSCATCHDLGTNGASGRKLDEGLDGAELPLNTSTVFNAALNFRLNWEGAFRTLEDQARATIENPRIMDISVEDVVSRLAADPDMAASFRDAYGREPDAAGLLAALAEFQRTLVTPDSPFDRWLEGDDGALSAEELEGYEEFKSLGCAACHQGGNVGGNLFQRHGIFHPLASPEPKLLRVPSLRNIETTAPYFHDGSAPTLEVAVRRMARAQLNSQLTDRQVISIVAFLRALTGEFRGRQVGAP